MSAEEIQVGRAFRYTVLQHSIMGQITAVRGNTVQITWTVPKEVKSSSSFYDGEQTSYTISSVVGWLAANVFEWIEPANLRPLGNHLILFTKDIHLTYEIDRTS